MASEPEAWGSVPLETLAEETSPITYGVVKPGEEGEVPFVRGGDIAGGRVLIEQLRTITSEVSQLYRRTLLRGGELLVSLVGNPGRVAIAPASLAGANIARQVGLVRLRHEVDSGFVSYFLQSPKGQEALGAQSLGSVQQVINLKDLKTVKVPLPPLPEQKAIARILGTLDDKIELNRRMNATLEAMARALFQNWLETHESEIEEHRAQSLIDSRTLLIGDGYRAKNSEMGSGGLPFVRAGNLKENGLDLSGAEVLGPKGVKAAGHKHGQAGDVAFTSKGTVGRITRVSLKTGPFVYSPQVCFWRSLAPERLHPNVLYRWMSTDSFMQQVDAASRQTDMAPYVSLQDQRKMVILLPPATAQKRIANQLQPIDDKIAANAEQSRTLATLRDTLLPKLLSGEIQINR